MLGGATPIPAKTWVGWDAYGVQIDKQVLKFTARGSLIPHGGAPRLTRCIHFL